MNKKLLSIIVVVVVMMMGGVYFVSETCACSSEPLEPFDTSELSLTDQDALSTEFNYTERYSAYIDRVEVVFEHKDYTQYQLRTNERVQKGDLNTERGFENDEDATVYVLNWQKPAGEQILYVRLTAEPGRLYLLDSERNILRGSVLYLQP
jgi:hypothetical protein